MDAVTEVATVPASSDTITITQESTNTFNVNQSNNNTHTHANAHIGSNSLANKTTSSVISSSNSNINIGGSNHSSSSNSSCSSSSTSSNSSGYGSSTTTPTNNYDLQQTTPTTTPIPTTPVAPAEHIIPVATVAAVTPFYNESITTHNLDTHHVQHVHHHSQQQHQQQHQQQPHQHHLLQSNHHQYSENHLQTNLQQQHHQYLPRQQYYSPYEYQQTAPTHNLAGSATEPAVASYNMIVPGPYDMPSSLVTPSYGADQYKPSGLAGAATNYERSSVVKTHATAPTYSQQHSQPQQLQQQGEQQQPKRVNQQTHHFTSLLGSSKQRSSSLISGTTNTNTSKPQAAATPFYANPTPFYENFKHKMPLEYHDTYSNPSPTAAVSYHQQQKFYAAAKSQLKEASYGSPTGLNSKSLYGNTGNYFPAPTAGLNLSSATYDKYSMYSHNPATGYATTGHLGNETPPEVSNYRKPVVANAMNSPSWPWGIDYASGSSRSIPPPATHIPTATVAPTHATHLTQNPTVLARDSYYMGHDKYGVKYDKYTNPSYQQSYANPPTNRHIWPNASHTPNLNPLTDRHLLGTVPPALPSHGLHTTSYFPNTSATSLNSRQSCCSQPYQPQSCYYPASHTVPTRQPHTQTPTVAPAAGGYLTPQQTFGQSPHLNALTASCKYGGVLTDYGTGNKFKNSNDLYLNTHQYDNNPVPHNFGYGSAHNSQPLYNGSAHQSMTHGPAPASLLTNDPLGSKPTSYTNDLTFTTSNFDNYHPHLDAHPSQQKITGIHEQQPPPAYGVTVAKRALLDYRKPIQPQPPPAITEDCYTTLTTTRDHYNPQELLNTPETTTTFGEYESHKSHHTTANLATEVLSDTERDRDENNKNLSLRDFIANWNDDEDEYQNNEEINFDQNTVIDEVLQTAAVDQESAAAAAVIAVEEVKVIKPFLADTKNSEILEQSVGTVEDLSATLSEAEASQYVNLPDIVIDIEKSNNVNNSITTPTTSPPAQSPLGDHNTSLNLSNFDVEKELDELNLKKPAQQELSKDLHDDRDSSKAIVTPHISPCKNLTFEDLNLEATNKTVLNAMAARLTTDHSTDLTEQYIEGYESSSSRHSNESAFEKEYETFINKITSESCAKETELASSAAAIDIEAEKEVDFEKNVHNFSKFHKRKRKLKEDDVKTAAPAIQSKKKLKATEVAKVNNSNFPQAYTKKSRNKLTKTKIHGPRKRKPLSAYYKIIHSIRRFGPYRAKCVREYMAELKEKHLPLIKRQSIKNYTHDITESLCNAKTLKALCIMAINTKEFRESLLLSVAETKDNSAESEEKHICTDPSCETCEVIKSLMEAESFETTLMQQATATNEADTNFSSTIFCAEGDIGTIRIFETTPNTDDLNFHSEESIVISKEITNFAYSKEHFSDAFDTKDLEKHFLNTTDVLKIVTPEDVNLENCAEACDNSALALPAKDYFEIPLQPAGEIAINAESLVTETDELKFKPTNLSFPAGNHSEILEENNTETDNCSCKNRANDSNKNPALSCEPNKCDQLNAAKYTSPQISFSDQTTSTSAENAKNLVNKCPELNQSSANETATRTSFNNEKFAATKHDEESESEDSDSSDSETDTDSSSSDSENKSIAEKSNSSGTETEEETDNEDATANSDSDESQHSENMPSNTKAGSESRRKAIDHSNRTDIESEEGSIPTSSPQRIVIRITKSLSPNDQSLRVENIFGKSSKLQTEVGSQIESQEKEECGQVSNISTQNLNQEDCVPGEAVEVHTGSKLEPNFNKPVTNLAPLKLILRKQDFSKEQTAEKSEVDENIDTESENEGISQEINEGNETTSKEETFFNKRMERECEDDEISGLVRTRGLTLSPRKAAEVSENCDKESKSEMVSTNCTSRAKEPKVSEDKFFEESSETYSDHKESDGLSKEISEAIPTSLESTSKSKECFEDFSAEIPGGIFSKATISESKTETVSSPRKINVEENEVSSKSVPSQFHTDNEFTNKEAKSAHISTSLTLELGQEDVPLNSDFLQEEDPFIDDVFNDNSEPSSNKSTNMNSINEYSPQNNTVPTDEFEVNTETRTGDEVCSSSQLSCKDDHRTQSESRDDDLQETVKDNANDPEEHYQNSECGALKEIEEKKSNLTSNHTPDYNNTDTFSESIEICDLTSSESEEEQQSDTQSILSISESSYDSEYESDDCDKAAEPIVKFNNSNPIVISDDESLDTSDSKDQLPTTISCFRKTSEDDLHETESDSELNSIKETQEALIGKENELLLCKKQTDLVLKHLDYSIDQINAEVKDLQVVQSPEDEKECDTFNYASSDDDTHSETEFTYSGRKLPEKTTIEKYVSEYTSSEEEFLDGSDGKISDDSIQNYKELLQPLEQSGKNVKNRDYDSEDVSMEYSRSPDIPGTPLPVQNENVPEITDCETAIMQPNNNKSFHIEEDDLQNCQIKTNEDLNAIQEKCEGLQRLSVIGDQMKTETTESQETIDNSKSGLQAKVENTGTPSQTVDVIDPVPRSSSFASESQKLSKETKNGENDFDQNINENISIDECKTDTPETSTSVCQQKENKPQGMRKDSITTEDIYKSDNDVAEDKLIEPGRPSVTGDANTNLSEEAEFVDNKFNQNEMGDATSSKPLSDVFEEGSTDFERLPVKADAITNIMKEAKVSEKKLNQIMMEDGNSNITQANVLKEDLTDFERPPVNTDATNISRQSEVLESNHYRIEMSDEKSLKPLTDVFEEDSTDFERLPVKADANTNISKKAEVIEKKFNQIVMEDGNSNKPQSDVFEENLTDFERPAANTNANTNQIEINDGKSNRPQSEVFEEELTESCRSPVKAEANTNVMEEAKVVENKINQNVVEVRILSNKLESDVPEEDLTESGKYPANADENTNILEEDLALPNNLKQIIMENRKTQDEEKTIAKDLESPADAPFSPTIEEITPQNQIEEEFICNKKNPEILEDDSLAIREMAAQNAAEEKCMDLDDIPAEVNLGETNLATDLLPTTAEEHFIDRNEKLGETETFDESKDLKEALTEPVSKNTEVAPEKLFQNSNISAHDETLQVSYENKNVIDHTLSERISKAEDKSPERMARVRDYEISNEKEIATENSPTESASTLQIRVAESSGSTLTNDDAKVTQKITKTAEETSIQSTPASLEAKIEHSENISHLRNPVNEPAPEEYISPPIYNQIRESEGKHLEEIFSEVEADKTTTTAKQLAAEGKSKNKVLEESSTPSESLEEIPEAKIVLKEITTSDDIIEEQKFISQDFSSSDLAGFMDEVGYESIAPENFDQNSDELPKEFNQITSPQKSSEALLEKTNSNEVELGSEFECNNSADHEQVQASEEESAVDPGTSSPAEDNLELDSTEICENSGERVADNIKTLATSDKLECANPPADQTFEAEHQADASSQHAPTKDCSTSDDMSTDFFGFKNQSSFEDESEDFHGFEDLEEVTRIREEMEKLNDDSTANDGFLNTTTLNRQIYKSTAASLTDSMSSEVNELEALEKELSQHQPKIQVEDKETELEDLPRQPIEVASTNDIEHIKQMLESDEELQTDGEEKFEEVTHLCKNQSVENSNNHISKYILSSVSSIIPKLSDLCRAALNSSSNSNSNLAQQVNSETSAFVVERELSVEEALAEMYRQAGVLLSDPEDCDNDIPSPAHNEAHDVLLINLQEILNSDNNDVYVLQCDMNENVLNVVQSTEDVAVQHRGNDVLNTERVNTVQIIVDTQNPDPQIHIISSDSESEVIILSDDDSEFSYRPNQERVTIPFINDNDINDSESLFDISTIHHEEIVPDNLNKFLQEEFYKYLHEKYVQRNISKYYHANRVLKKYKRRFIRTSRQ